MPWTQTSGFYQQGLSLSRAGFKEQKSAFRPDSHRTLAVRIQSCLPPALWPGFPGRLSSPFHTLLSWDYNLQNHTERSPSSPPFLLIMVDTVVSVMKPAPCSSCIQPLENNLYMHLKAQKSTMIRGHPIAPMTQICNSALQSKFLDWSLYVIMQGMKELLLHESFNVPKVLALPKLELIDLSFEIGGKVPHKRSWTPSHECCWLEFHFREVTHSLEQSGSQVSCWQVPRASCHSPSHITTDFMAESLTRISWSIPVCWIISWGVLVRLASTAWPVWLHSARAVAATAAMAAIMIAETIQAMWVPKKHHTLTWERAQLRGARPPGSSHLWVTLTGSQVSVCMWTTKTIVRLSWVTLAWVRQLV